MTTTQCGKRLAQVICQTVILAGCAHGQRAPATPQVTPATATPGYSFVAFPASRLNTDTVFVALTFSGGGTRAAAFAYGVLRELGATQIDTGSSRRSLLGEVDLISSVSGGSFTAAAFALNGEVGLSRFEHSFLRWNAEDALKRRGVLTAARWLHVFGGSYGRGDVAADLWNTRVFSGATFQDLIARHHRPFLLINATDMAAAAPFSFTQEWFGPMCDDLGSV